ncbi:MAG: hypothetical protein LPK45_10475, partial [Bacteroidota bacterium]|nr:hypothetical protein [Bacteroidota bacterium]MDX5431523.1 hypothetical protein [Bacteroidota bacterium]MDX5470244.1 hypothetical protein [Bacteroidota bacterium]
TQPKLYISLNQKEGQYHLLFGDNGPGIHAKALASSFGLKLANAQVKQLKGTLSSRSENGLQYKVVFE